MDIYMKKTLWILHFIIFIVTSGVALFIFFVQANNLNILTQDSDFIYGEIMINRPVSLSGSYKESPAVYVMMDRNL
jgi:hypothetical protein